MPMDELTIESFAADMAQADKPEQPHEDSGQADVSDGENSALEHEQVDAPEGETEAQAEQPEEDSASKEPVHKWTTANGDAYEVSESELRNGYLRQQDYVAKRQADAESARQTQAQLQTLGQQQLQAIGEIHSDLMSIGALNSQIQALAAQGMSTADLKVELWQAQQRVGSKLNSFQGALANHSEQTKRAAVSAAEQHLQAKFPSITPKDVGDAFSHIQKLKPSDSEIELIRTNPRLAEIAMLAGKYLELQAKKPEVQNKVRNLPPPAAKRSPAPTSKTEAAVKAINSRRNFSTVEFATLLKSLG